MLSFRVTRIVPPGGKYFFGIDGVEFEAYTLRDVLADVRRHYAESGRETPEDLQAVVVDYMCRRLPEGFCYGTLDGAPRARTVTMAQIRDNTMRKAAGCARTPQPEVQRRAVTCANCKCNDRTLCPTCVGLVSWASRLVGRPMGAREEWLGVCSVDAVALSAVVHLDDKEPEGECPAGCWRKK